MALRLDHIVIAVSDLAKAVEDYRALGFTVTIGGKHPGRNSHNALVIFADGAYLEIIAWSPPSPGERWYDLLAKHGEGLVDFALLPRDTASAVAAMKARGLAYNGPIDGGRVRPDGRELKWQTARPETADLPFLCGDVTPREGRVPEGEIRRHANGAAGVASIAVAVRSLEASIARYRALLGADADIGAPAVLAGHGLRVALVRMGESAIVLQTPSTGNAAAGEPPAAGALRERLAAQGEGPCGLALRTTAGGATPGRIRTHGVPLELVPPPAD
jgi:catechol 2,3-dioxygenase-like lactoylglutathione lyase family enzyme